jgi:hypothetical protein
MPAVHTHHGGLLSSNTRGHADQHPVHPAVIDASSCQAARTAIIGGTLDTCATAFSQDYDGGQMRNLVVPDADDSANASEPEVVPADSSLHARKPAVLPAYDAKRALHLLLFNLLSSPVGHFWFQWLDQCIMPGAPTAIQVLLNPNCFT